MSIDAMKQALEALEYIENNYMSLPAPAIKAITALRLAIEQAERQESYWQEEARRYAGNADFWREKAKRQPMVVSQECAERGCMAHDDRVDGPGTQVYRSELEAAVKAAIEAEREACAKVCDEEGLYMTAAAIRARGEKK